MLNSIQPVHLRCEYLGQPLGIDEPQPRLSWTLESSRRNVRQSAYQIQVMNTDKALRWDSGRVESDAMAQIVYAGQPLVSRMRRCVSLSVPPVAGGCSESAWRTSSTRSWWPCPHPPNS